MGVKKRNFKYAFYKYAIVIVLFIELFSAFMYLIANHYTVFMYSLTTQLSLVILTLSFTNLPRAIVPCKRKKVAMYCLSSYYLFNSICLFVRPLYDTYVIYVSLMLLISSLFIIITTIKKIK